MMVNLDDSTIKEVQEKLNHAADMLFDPDLPAVAEAVTEAAKAMNKLTKMYQSMEKLGEYGWVVDELVPVLENNVGERLGAAALRELSGVNDRVPMEEFERTLAKFVRMGVFDKRGYRLLKVTPNGYRKYHIYRSPSLEPDL